MTLRSFANASRIVCEYCDTLINNDQTGVSIVQKLDKKMKIKPKIPLGSRGRFEGKEWEIVGFMKRQAADFYWFEYLLFNPYYGYRFLAESDRHWSFVKNVHSVPRRASAWHPSITYNGETFKQFSSYSARVSYVVGEFFWRVQTGDSAHITDYINPPYLISKEENRSEVNYSLAKYMSPEDVYSAFKKTPRGVEPFGVMPNQPNPHQKLTKELGTAGLLALLVFGLWTLIYIGFSSNMQVSRNSVPCYLRSETVGSPGLYTSKEFVVPKGGRNLVMDFYVPNLQNTWAAFDGNLIHVDSEEARAFSVELEYWSGSDWSEGSRSTSLVFGNMPQGKYKLVLAPSCDISKGRGLVANIGVRWNVALYRYVFLVLIMIGLVPFIQWLRYQTFETERWSQSDFGGDD